MHKKLQPLIIGGLEPVGIALTHLLAHHKEFSKPITLTRRRGLEHISINKVVPFNELGLYENILNVDFVFLCTGTATPSEHADKAFFDIIREQQENIIDIAADQGTRHFCLFSLNDADPKSTDPALKMKGRVEQYLTKKNLPKTSIFRLQPLHMVPQRTVQDIPSDMLALMSAMPNIARAHIIYLSNMVQIAVNKGVAQRKRHVVYLSDTQNLISG